MSIIGSLLPRTKGVALGSQVEFTDKHEGQPFRSLSVIALTAELVFKQAGWDVITTVNIPALRYANSIPILCVRSPGQPASNAQGHVRSCGCRDNKGWSH